MQKAQSRLTGWLPDRRRDGNGRIVERPHEAPECEDLVRERAAMDYTEAEQQFSQFVQVRMHRLLRGDDNRFVLMRRYSGRRVELGFFMPARIQKSDIRPGMAEAIVYGVLRFLDPFAPGGPVAQAEVDGLLREIQTFPTQFPHIVVERTDVFNAKTGRCLFVEWQAARVQNQRKSMALNRALDLSNLALELARLLRP